MFYKTHLFRRDLVLSVLCTALSFLGALRGDITNSITLKKVRPTGEQYVTLVGMRHILASQGPEYTNWSLDTYLPRLHADIKEFITTWEQLKQEGTWLLLEAQRNPDDLFRHFCLPLEHCFCLLGIGYTENCNNMWPQVQERSQQEVHTNILNVLARQLEASSDAAIFYGNRRGDLDVLAYLVNAANSLSQAVASLEGTDYDTQAQIKSCFEHLKRHHITVKDFFEQGIKTLTTIIRDAQSARLVITHQETLDELDAFIEELELHKNLWALVGESFSAFLHNSFLHTFLIQNYQRITTGESSLDVWGERLLQGTLPNPSPHTLLSSLDYAFLSRILAPEAPHKLLVATGFLHVGSVARLLMREGYTVVGDTGITCNDRFKKSHRLDSYDLSSIYALCKKGAINPLPSAQAAHVLASLINP